MLPSLRKKLRNVSSKNQSLQDILQTCKIAKEVLSIIPVDGKLHNTKITLLVNEEEIELANDRYIERVHFYTRLDLANIMTGLTVESKELPAIILELNLKGYDFTEDDLELVNNKITAKPSSFGYIGFHDQIISNNIEIICDGALPVTTPVYTEGKFELVIDGVLLGTGTIEELQPIALEHGIQIYYAPTPVVY